MKKIGKSSKIFLAGHEGLLGSSLLKALLNEKFLNITTKKSKDLDLTNQKNVKKFFKRNYFDLVILTAAKAGGIKAHIGNETEFLYENLMIALNVIKYSYENNIKNIIFFGSNCMYPELCSQPIKEKYLLSGKLEKNISYYATAKISSLKLCEAFNKQYKTKYKVIIPPNLLGHNDNFDLQTAHVAPALLNKFHNAKIKGLKSVNVWGNGKQTREFLYVGDLTNFVIFLIKNWYRSDKFLVKKTFINVGTGVETSIKELSMKIADLIKYSGKIIFDKKNPAGTPRKVLDISLVKKFGWKPNYSLECALSKTYKKKFIDINN